MCKRLVVRLLFLIFALSRGAAGQSASVRQDIPAIARAGNGSIVSIVMSDKEGKPIAQGSGFFVTRDGLILTNYHVIAEGASAVVKLPDGAFYAVDGVLALDKKRDVALIKARGDNFRSLTLGNSDRVQVGEEVVAIGNPLSLESTVSDGIISGIRDVKEEGRKYLQITAPISPGSSGGPLFNMDGEVVGITTMYLKGGENLNFAIPINDAKRLLYSVPAKIRALPNEPEPVEAQTHDEDTPSREMDAPTIFFDDIAYPEDGNQFSAAFALEPACSGLSLMTWKNHTPEERNLSMERSEWDLMYATLSGRRGGVVRHRHSGTIGVDPEDFDFQVGFKADSPEDAARMVCSIVKSHGGKIR